MVKNFVKVWHDRITPSVVAFVLVLSSVAAIPVLLHGSVYAAANVHTADLSTWDLSQTRTKGHNELLDGGLRVWTDSNDSESKAAGYYLTPGLSLSEVSSTSITFASFIDGRPSVQLVVDRDNNGTLDGYLVYEPWAYADGYYWTNGSGFGVPGGMGYTSYGTLQQYQDANPSAKILAIGYSLGSGVKGDAVISSIQIGTTSYTFGLTATPITGPTLTAPANGSAYKTSDLPVAQTWTKVTGATKYLYESYLTNPETDPSATPVHSQERTTNSRNIGNTAAEGTYYWRVKAITPFESEWSEVRTFSVDNSAPSISWQEQPDALYAAGQGFHVRPITNEVGTTKSVYIDSVAPENLVWTLTSDHKNFDTKNTHNQALWDSLTDGTHKFVAVFTDYAGNSTTRDSNSFIIDRTGPTIYVKSGSTLVPVSSLESTIFNNVSFKLFDTNKIDKVEINGVVKNLTDNSWSDVNGVKPGTFGAIEGPNTLIAYDVAGNTTTFTFTLDTTAPNGTLAYSNNNGNTVTKDDVTVTLTTDEPIETPTGWTKVSDTVFTKVYGANTKSSVIIKDLAGNTRTLNYEVKRIDRINPVFVNVSDGGVYGSSIQVVVHDQSLTDKLLVNGTPVQLTNTSGWDWTTATPIGPDGVYELTAYDKAGNATTITITIDTIAPAAPAITSGSANSVSGTAEPSSTVTVLIGGLSVGTISADSSGSWTLEFTPSPLGVGTHLVTAFATDAAGNESNTSSAYSIIVAGGSEDTSGNSLSDFDSNASSDLQQSVNQIIAGGGVPAATLSAQTTNPNVSASAVAAAETEAVDGEVAENEKEIIDKASSAFQWWWLIVVAAAGLFFIIAWRRRKADEK